jgi:hypothetical protein
MKFTAICSFFEIYNENIYDLVTNKYKYIYIYIYKYKFKTKIIAKFK